jgi:hypothetical protein
MPVINLLTLCADKVHALAGIANLRVQLLAMLWDETPRRAPFPLATVLVDHWPSSWAALAPPHGRTFHLARS